MIKYIIIPFAIIFISSKSYSQYINNFLKLDTLLYFDASFDYSKHSSSDGMIWFLDKKKSNYDNDSIAFITIESDTYKKNNIYAIIPNLKMRSKYYQYPFNFSVKDDYLYLTFNTFMAVMNNNASQSYLVTDFIPFEFPITQQFITDDNDIILCNSYKDPTIVNNWFYALLYNQETKTFSKTIYPNFDHIEFCYFSPNKWIDFYGGKLAMSQTTSYDIKIMNADLTANQELSRSDIAEWKEFSPTSLFDTAKLHSSPNKYGRVNPSSVMNYLRQHLDKISRIETINFLSDTLLLVSYYNSNPDKTIDRRFDVWNLNSTSLKHKDLTLYEFLQSDTININKFPIYYNDSEMIVLPNLRKILFIRQGGSYSDFNNVTYENFKNQEDTSLEKDDLLTQVFIFTYSF